MDSSPHGSGGAFLAGGLGRGGSGGGGGKGSSGSGISMSAIGGGGASADAWTRLASSGVEDDLAFPVGGGGGGAGSGPGPGGMPYGHFLDACFLCRKPIASNRDIFMYRGDIPFCSEECRREQMEADEEMERKEKGATKKLSPRPASLGEVESPPRPPKTRAGSILAG